MVCQLLIKPCVFEGNVVVTLMKLLLFIPACFALNMTPGPNNLLSMTNAQRYNIRVACYAGLGRLLAFAGLIILTALGLATVLYASEKLFLIIKVVGGVYLLVLAFQLWRADGATQVSTQIGGKSRFALAQQEFFLAAGNPKAILIFTAFLPQFVDPAGDVTTQLLYLGALFLVLECGAIFLYAFFGRVLGHWFARPEKQRWFNRVCATLLGSAGVGLLFVSRD